MVADVEIPPGGEWKLEFSVPATLLQCIIGTQIYGSGEADIPTMTSDWVIADI